ncbi:UNVERIFIED_CONTAM: C2 domain-containing protein 3 [Siphonaria sp. JEL0065]|nr:C2 domain-containing protein 3 [Siphonaria sp. JEL0065]
MTKKVADHPPISLPPNVAGPITGVLRVSIAKVVFKANALNAKRVYQPAKSKTSKAKGEGHASVRLTWWGSNDSDAALFYPLRLESRTQQPKLSVTNELVNKAKPTTLRFNVHCPKQNLCAYLRDMGPLVLVVVGTGVGEVGRASVGDLSVLAGEPYAKPITGWFPILAPDASGSGAGLKQLGELHFSAAFEQLTPQSVAKRPSSRVSLTRASSIPRSVIADTNQSVGDVAATIDDGVDDFQQNEDQVPSSDYRGSQIPVFSKQGSKTVVFDLKDRISESDSVQYDNNNGLECDSQTDESGYYDEAVSANYTQTEESMMEFPQTPPVMSTKPSIIPGVLNRSTSNITNQSVSDSSLARGNLTRTASNASHSVPAAISRSASNLSSHNVQQPQSILNRSSSNIPNENSTERQHSATLVPATATKEKKLDHASNNTAFSDVYARALRLKKQISEAVLDSSAKVSKPPSNQRVGYNYDKDEISDVSINSENSVEQLVQGLDHYATDTDYRVLHHEDEKEMKRSNSKKRMSAFSGGGGDIEDYYVRQELEVEVDESSSSSSAGSDFVDDDLIIEALNSGIGGGFRNNRVGDQGDVEDVDDFDKEDELIQRLLNRLRSDDEDEDYLLEEYGNRNRHSSTQNHGQSSNNFKPSQTLSRPMAGQSSGPSAFFNLDTITALGRVHSIRVYVNKLEAKTANLSPFLTSFVIDYELRANEATQQGDTTLQQKIGSRMVSTALPRLATSAPKGTANNTKSNSECVVSFDKQDIYPVVFDGKMAESWLDSWLDINVIATQSSPSSMKKAVGTQTQIPSRKLASGPKKSIWEAHGSWKCREVLVNNEFYWTGRVPLFMLNNQVPPPAPKGKTGPSLTATTNEPPRGTTKHIGDIILTVELISNHHHRVVNSEKNSEPFKLKSNAVAASSVKAEDPKNSPTASRPESPTLQQKPLPSLPPHYLFFTITTARALAIFPSTTSDSSTTLLHLSLRLFNASTPPSTTPPIPYLPPFDLTTGKLNPPLNFDYAVTVPMAITPAFLLGSGREVPLVVEVWAVSPVYPSHRTTFTTSTDDADNGGGMDPILETVELVEEGGKRLLGLMKLPVQVLVSTLADMVLGGGGASGNNEHDAPVLLPEAEYPIVDPFSGVSKGWVRAFMALGTWSQIVKLPRKSAEGYKSPERKRKSEFESVGGESAALSPVREREERRKEQERHQSETEREFSERIIGGSAALKPATSPQRRSQELAESSLVVQIHGACGLQALLADLIRIKDSKKWSLDQPLSSAKNSTIDVANSLGPNSYIVLRVFPVDLLKSDSSNRKSGNPSVVTPTAQRSFTPSYNHNATVALPSIDTDLLQWIQKGGLAIGEVWHRASLASGSSDPAGYGEEEVLLGTFTVPLQKLVERVNGVQGEWMPIDPVGDFEGSVFRRSRQELIKSGSSRVAAAAVKVSIRFLNGLDIVGGESLDESISGGGTVKWGCRLNVLIRDIAVSAGLNASNDGSGTLKTGDLISTRWKYPVVDGSDIKSVWIASDAFALGEVDSVDGLFHCGINEFQFVALEMCASVLSHLKNGPFVIEVVQKSSGQDESVIGTVCIDVWNAVSVLRKAYRRGNVNDVGVVDDAFPLINPKSLDLGGSRMSVKLELCLFDASKTETESLAANLTSVLLQSQESFNSNPSFRHSIAQSSQQLGHLQIPQKQTTIPLHITIDRAIQLYSAETPTTQQNTFATISWPLTPNVEISSQVIPATSSPAWKFHYTLLVKRDLDTLKKLKMEMRYIEIIVWIAKSAGENQEMGTVKVDFGPLFTGCTEIQGWYPVVGGVSDTGSSSNGQVLVKVEPGENLGAALMEVSSSGNSVGAGWGDWRKAFGVGSAGTANKPVVSDVFGVGSDTPVIKPMPPSTSPDPMTEGNIVDATKLAQVVEGAGVSLLTRPCTPILIPPSTISMPESTVNSSPRVPVTRTETPNLPPASNISIKSDSAIEDFSLSLQRTVDELNALQEMIRNRGLKSLELESRTKTTFSRTDTPQQQHPQSVSAFTRVPLKSSLRVSANPSPSFDEQFQQQQGEDQDFFVTLNKVRESGINGGGASSSNGRSRPQSREEKVGGEREGHLTLEDLDFNFDATVSGDSGGGIFSDEGDDEQRGPRRGDEFDDGFLKANNVLGGNESTLSPQERLVQADTAISLNYESVMRESSYGDSVGVSQSSYPSAVASGKKPYFSQHHSDSETDDLLNSILSSKHKNHGIVDDSDERIWKREVWTHHASQQQTASSSSSGLRIKSEIQAKATEYASLVRKSPPGRLELAKPGLFRIKRDEDDEENESEEKEGNISSNSSSSERPYDVRKILQQRRFKSSLMKDAADEVIRKAQLKKKRDIDLDEFEKRYSVRKGPSLLSRVGKFRFDGNAHESSGASSGAEEGYDDGSDSDFSLVFSPKVSVAVAAAVVDEEDVATRTAKPSGWYSEDVEIEEILERSRHARLAAQQKVLAATVGKPPLVPS